MASNLLWLNGTDAADLGFYLADAPDLLGEGSRTPQTIGIPQGVGVLLSSAPVSVGPRSLRLSGYVTAGTVSAARAVLDTLKAHVGTGVVEMRSAWNTGRTVRGVLIAANAGPSSQAWLGRISVDLEFLCFDPFAYSGYNVIGFGATSVAIPLGTAPSVGRSWWSAVITITGAATTPTLTEEDATGTALRTMAFSGWSPTASDAIEIDLGRGLVTRITAGVRTNGIADLTAGWEFPALDPADGNYSTSAFPRLSVSSGTGFVRYCKAYR